jgi:hypothetical protein
VVDYGKVARFKLGTRKKEYRVGETVGIILAVFNTSDHPAFFLQPEWPHFKLKFGAGQEHVVVPFIPGNSVISPENMTLLPPSHTLSGSMLFIAGCPSPNKDTEVREPLGDSVNDRATFESGRLGIIERACLAFSGPGDYTITAELDNPYVLEDSDNPSVKTAVGQIRSEPLTIRITDH